MSAHQAFVFNGNSHPAHRIHALREFVFELEKAPPRLLEDTLSAAISPAGFAMYSAIMRLPVSSVRSKSDIRPDHAVRRYRKWQALCAADRPRGRRTRDGRPLTSLPYRATKKKTGICKAGTSFIMFSFDTSDHIASREKRKPPAGGAH